MFSKKNSKNNFDLLHIACSRFLGFPYFNMLYTYASYSQETLTATTHSVGRLLLER